MHASCCQRVRQTIDSNVVKGSEAITPTFFPLERRQLVDKRVNVESRHHILGPRHTGLMVVVEGGIYLVLTLLKERVGHF